MSGSFWNPLSCYYVQPTFHLSTITHSWNMRHLTRNTKDDRCCPIVLKVDILPWATTKVPSQNDGSFLKWGTFSETNKEYRRYPDGFKSDAPATIINLSRYDIQYWYMRQPIRKTKDDQRCPNCFESYFLTFTLPTKVSAWYDNPFLSHRISV